ncbi:uncharacterized protein [Macrobrachium rosenbergii]|uniref:uncharacterized protein isoform X3 n=1 Tax=Macrobrachium rosenbergii TaxID=79674 RepID=UPI0034D41014
MNWSQEKTVEFIEEYRKLAVLWDIRLTEYKNNHGKLDALRGLAEKFSCDVAQVKKKIKNLRTAFRREHKSLTQKKSGSSPIKGSKWFAYDLLIFILDVDNPRPGYSSEVEPQAEQPIRVEVTGGESHAEDNLDLAFDMEGDGTQHSVDSQKSTNIRENSSPVDPIAIKRPRKQITDVDEECETFGRHVAVQLKQLPTTQRILAQDELQKVLTRYRLAAINGGPAASPQPSASDNYYSDPLTIVKEEVDET